MKQTLINLVAGGAFAALLGGLVLRPDVRDELPNRIPEAAPYDTVEAEVFPPPFEPMWRENNAGRCATCHERIFSQWNGSMMSNSWRDPAWRGAFLMIARLTATDGDCDVPEPPDGTAKAVINPFAQRGCTSRFDTGEGKVTTSRGGSLLDGFCSRCHMPTNYIDNIPTQNVSLDATGREHGRLNSDFDPTSDNGTGMAFATDPDRIRNTESGKSGLFCTVCHTMAETRETPFHNYRRVGQEYAPAAAEGPRRDIVSSQVLEPEHEPAPQQRNLGYGIGAGSYRLSPHAIESGEVFGPLAATDHQGAIDNYVSEVFDTDIEVAQGKFEQKHQGFEHIKFQRAEMCSACHDVTNPLTLKNVQGNWVGGFPIERTYTEWASSRYADRPGNTSFDPAFKRDCQTCHMQQELGQPGTAQTLYQEDGAPEKPLRAPVSSDGPERVFYSHHFIGGNAYVPRLIGTDVDPVGRVAPYPELSVFSYSSADPKSLYHNAYWTHTDNRGVLAQHARLAWDRLRHALEVDVELGQPAPGGPGRRLPIRVTVRNTGAGHNFPTGFPEGRAAWLAVRAYDLASGAELEIYDAEWRRTARGVGYLTDHDMIDPNFPGCDWPLPAGSPDPYSFQMKAVASLGDGCPTLDLVYATPLNLVLNDRGLPIDAEGRVIDRRNPEGLPQFRDLDGDGDIYDDAYLLDTRLRPMPLAGARKELDRYSVLVPEGTVGPVAVSAVVYYQSIEGMVAKKFLGNLADTDTDFALEPCVLGGLCDGRTPSVEPAVVEGAPPVPMAAASRMRRLDVSPSPTAPGVRTYPEDGATAVARDVVVKATFSSPVEGVDEESFTLQDDQGRPVAASVQQIGDGTWALFPDQVFLPSGARFVARLSRRVCDPDGACLEQQRSWSFTIAEEGEPTRGDTTVPLGFAQR